MRLRRRLFLLDVVVGVFGLALIALSLVVTTSASAATSAGDGSDWGAQGQLASESEQTARWDNTGNSAASTVPRDAGQSLPHTAGKTYADVAASDRTAYASHFGAANGKGGLQVSVSQTENLVNQAVTVQISGADPDIPAGTGELSRTYFQIFQCWGAMGSNGQPEADPSSPDPDTCEVGAPGLDESGVSVKREYRTVGGDPLVAGGDWAPYDVTSSLVEVPFQSITNEVSGPNLTNQNGFFTKVTTNEFSYVTVPASGSTARQFEVQTGVESQGLGCGTRTDAPSTPNCWLVVVPRIAGVDDEIGPISPSVWAQRMQFKLGFQPIATSCGAGSRSLLGGSEMLADAASSWIPQVCDVKSVNLGYTRLGDEVARNQYAAGSSSAILTSQPLPATESSIPVPLALTAPVFAYAVDYQPVCTDPDDDPVVIAADPSATDADAVACGYDDLADLRADAAKAGQPIRELNLDARLVAKLLTMSYQSSILGCAPGGCGYLVAVKHTLPAWTVQRPVYLTADPEFRALNPQLAHLSDNTNIGDLILEAARSDAAAQIWQWLLADPAAASFLSGCPDDNDVVINPFFSSRTYTGCAGQAADLIAKSLADRDATTKPSTFVDNALAYPPTGSPYPFPQWQERAATSAAGVLTLVDFRPRVDNMIATARDVFLGYKPSNSVWCATASDPSCLPAPGKYTDPKTRQQVGLRQNMSITDAQSAARYQIPTAALCDDTGAHCVQANTTTLRAAAAEFVPSATTGYLQPAATADYAGGAYPLTMPVYAAIRPSLSQADRTAYANAFDYITGQGQVPGYDQGSLPPGFAPLTDNLKTQATSAIATLRLAGPATASAKPTTSASSTKPSTKPTKKPSASASGSSSASASATGTASSTPGPGTSTNDGVGGSAAPPTDNPPGASSAAAAASATATTTVQTVPVAASTDSWPGWVLPLGVGLALGAGMAGPFLRRRSNVRLR